MEKKTVSAMMLTLLLTSMLTLAFNIQLMKAHSEGTTYEEFGPRADKLLFKLYPSETAEWDALTRGEIDITDWPLPKSYYELFNSNTINPATGLPYKETINVIFYGDEFDLRILDLNNNNNTYLGNPPNPAYPNPVYPNPTSVKEMRQAIAYLTDRAQLETIIGAGFYSPLYTPVPHSMGAYSHPEIRPGGALEALTYPYSRADAEAELDAGGFPMGPDGWRYWDCNSNGVKDEDEELDLKFFIRSDDPLRKDMGNFIANELEAVKVKVNRTLGTITAASLQVMTNKDFHIYTGGWSFGIDPNHLILWNWDYYWHPDRCYNTAGCNNALFNTYSYGVMYATTYDEVKTNAWLAQEVFASEVLSVPLWSPAGSKAMSRYYTGGNKWTPVDPDDGENAYRGEYWDGVVNMPGYGVDNSFSLLNMHPRGIERGGTIRWGFKTTEIRSFNPIYAQGLWDWNVLESIYEALLVRNSYNPSELNPCLAQDFEVGIYNNPAYGECSKIRFTLRPDATWADGNPITAADVYFTFVELPSILKARGLPNPWWYSAVKSILNFKIFDSYNFEVLLNTRDYFATNWGGKTIILPKHVWKPIVEAGDPTTFAPDPNMIGSGPWRLMEYVQGSHVLLVANKPGSAAKTNLPGSRVIVSPQGYFRYSPVSIDAFTSVINRVTPTEANFNTTIRNSLPESVTINYVIRHKWPNGSTTVLESNSAVVIPGFNTLGHSLPSGGSVYGMHERIVEVIITEPQWVATTIDVTEPYWVTEREDINLDIFVNVQDCVIAGKAFGSYPGHVRWNGAADINDDYKIDARDVSWVQRRANASEWMAPEPQLGVVSLTVSPGSAIVTANTNFTVNVTVNNVVNLRGYQFTLFYDSTVLDLMKAEPNWIYSPWQGVSQINDNYNSTHGKYTQAIYAIESSSPPSFNGTTTLVTLTFQSLQDDSVCFNLTDTLLVNLDAEQIPHVRAPWTPTPPLIPGKDVPAEAPDFFTSVLAKLNIPTTEFAVQALTIWTNYENTNAYWNPLATTWPMGEKSWNFNAVGVKNYADKETGIQATANTLALHYYEPIRQMLAIQTFDEQRLREAVAIWAGLNPSDPYVVNLVDEWCEIYPVSADQPPICIISLQKDGIELDQVDVAEFFDIFAGYSQDDKGIKQIRFSSDDVHDGMPTGEWTQWYDWDASFGDWDAFTKIKRWAFATPGHKEVWAEVKDEAGNSNLCSATIFVPAPALPVLISPLVITPNKEIYNVGDTLEAEFAIKNIGSAPITLDVLTVGGRLNGFIPPEGAPDFTFRSVTLQPNESYQYEGSLTLTQTGNYHFFVAYYIENPTPNEKRLLDKNNWNTCVDLREGLTQTDRVKNIVVYEEGIIPEEVSKLNETINRWINMERQYPAYLIDPEVGGWAASVWVTVSSVWTHVQEEYDELWLAGADYSCMSRIEAVHAESFLDGLDINSAKKHLQKSFLYDKISSMYFYAATEVFDNNVKVAMETVKSALKLTEFGASLLNPAAGKFASYVFMVPNYIADTELVGIEQAQKNAVRDLIFRVIFSEYKNPELGDRTFENYVNNRIGKMTFPEIQAIFKNNEALQFYLSKALKKAAAEGAEWLSDKAESLSEKIVDELSKRFEAYISKRFSPIELRVRSPQGEITGLINGSVRHEISRSFYRNGTITIFFPSDSYTCEAAGKEEGTYGLEISSVKAWNATTFTATDIPTSTNIIHQYEVDWAALSQGEDGVTVQVDSNGDRVFEHTFTSDSELTQSEYVIATDDTPPQTWLSIGEPKFVVNDITYLTSATPIELIAEDNPGGSGVASTAYRIYNASYDSGWITCTQPFLLIGLSDGVYHIDYNSTDNTGNIEPTNTVTVILDNTPPITTLSIGEPKYVTEITYVTSATPITLEANDNTGSGVYSIAYRICNGSFDSGWLPYTAPFYLTALTDGVYTIEFNSTDNLSNTEATTSIQVTLFSWNYVFTDSYGRGTTLKINTVHKFFQFITPDKDYGIRNATYMRVYKRAIIIYHKDNELKLATVSVDTKLDFCIAYAKDIQTGKEYWLIDKVGTEN